MHKFIESLIENEYKRYEKSIIDTADYFYQKIIRREEDNKFLYAINIFVYDFNKYPDYIAEGNEKLKFSAQSNFYDKQNLCYNIEFSVENDMSIKEIENIFANFFERMNFIPDIVNN